MRTRLTPILSMTLGLLATSDETLAVAPTPEATLAIEHVGLISMHRAGHGGDAEPVLESDQTVLLAGDRILAVAASDSLAVPAHVPTIDGRGKYLIPGLADMHEHLPRADESGEPDLERYFDLLLTAGVTTIRSMRGAPGDPELRDALLRGERFGPRIVLGSPGIEGATTRGPDQARARVLEYRSAGFDFAKVLGGFSRETFLALADEARKIGLPLIGHLPAGVSLEDAIEAPLASIEHLHGHAGAYRENPNAFGRVAERTREAGTWVCPTLGFQLVHYGQVPLEEMLDWPGVEFTDHAVVEDWTRAAMARLDIEAEKSAEHAALMDSLYRTTGALHDAGVGLLVSSSGGPFLATGHSLFIEFGCLTRSGLSSGEILAAATVNAARSVGQADRWGSITPGLAADLVLLDGNPLEDLEHARRISAVVRGGQLFDRHALDGIQRRLSATR